MRRERPGGMHMDVRTVALCLAFAFSVALAQEARHPANERAAMLETMHRGKDIKGSRERYQHLPELLAVERASSAETPRQAIARIGAAGAPVVETKGRLVLFRSVQQKPAVAPATRSTPAG